MGAVQQGCTPRLAASARPDLECCHAQMMCQPGVDGLSDQECADILLVNGCVRGELEDVHRALEQGASVNTVAGLTLKMGEPSKRIDRSPALNVTPLMHACDHGHQDVMQVLLEARAAPEHRDSQGWNALCYALSSGEMDVARQLLALTSRKREAQLQVAVRHQRAILERCRKQCKDPDLEAQVLKEFESSASLSLTPDDGQQPELTPEKAMSPPFSPLVF